MREQYIGCSVLASSAGVITGECSARNAAGTYRTCHTSVPSQIQAIGTVSGMSDLLVYFDANGACTTITVRNYSYFGPEAP